MPKRTDLSTILIIGSGPIVIGQGAEFDYSGTQAVKALKEEGYRVILVNSNPATIMTDPELADRTYIEPVTPEWVAKVIERERPEALLPTMGGQTALNVAMALQRDGPLAQYGVELIGANERAIRLAEDREEFAQAMHRIGLATPEGKTVHSVDDALAAVESTGYPAILRPSFTLAGTGGGIAYNREEFETLIRRGLELSPVGSVLIERSVIGWKEFELEVMRDGADNVVIVCSIENLDPMGVHTGDSITVAPVMTLTDREYQHMRDVGIAVLRAVGVDTGGCNIQFAVNPETGRLVVIEMNPRVAFEKFPGVDPELTTTMKSVGEAMALGRSFPEALGKALRSMETSRAGFWTAPDPDGEPDVAAARDGRIYAVERALRLGRTVADVATESGIDPWFVDQILALTELRQEIEDAPVLEGALLRRAKRAGLSDRQIAVLRPELAGEDGVRALRHRLGIRPVYKTVDTCAAEFAARTPYHYSSYDEETEVQPREKPAVLILGSGPNRIGQGIEFDYSCVHASLALGAGGAGYETVMVNCNPETVSTDYDTSD